MAFLTTLFQSLHQDWSIGGQCKETLQVRSAGDQRGNQRVNNVETSDSFEVSCHFVSSKGRQHVNEAR